MPYYTHRQQMRCGLPIGGIGAGKIEIFPDGTIGNFTNQNNWGQPLVDGVGFCFLLAAETGSSTNAAAAAEGAESLPAAPPVNAGSGPGAGRVVRVLQTVPLPGTTPISACDLEGFYPVARLNYRDAALPVQVRLHAFTPLIPGELASSTLPVAVWVFQVANPTVSPVKFTLAAVVRNLNSAWNVGRFNQVSVDSDHTLLLLQVKDPLPNDERAGSLALLVGGDREHVSYLTQWNLMKAPFVLTRGNLDLAPVWNALTRDGRLPGGPCEGVPAAGEAEEPGGGLAVTLDLAAGESCEVPFVYAWHMPRHVVGHYYNRRFANASEVADHVWKNLPSLRRDTEAWVRLIRTAGLPEWLADALTNNLYVLSTSSWLGSEGEFALLEAPTVCPLTNTLDVFYYASVALGLLFPQLDRRSLEQYVMAQRPDGYIPHDLGRLRLDQPSDGTTAPPRWKDLVPKFILMVYRHHEWWPDSEWLRAMFPAVRRALEWEWSIDMNADGLPDNEGADQTYDNWDFYGANSYTSGIYLAAVKAAALMANRVGDIQFADLCRQKLLEGQNSFERQLWNGRYYQATAGAQGAQTACIAGQLNGQWHAHLLHLGYLHPRERVEASVDYLLSHNAVLSPYGAVNSLLVDGRVDEANAHSRSIWPGESYALAALAIYEGRVAAGLDLAEKTWRTFTDACLSPWDQPDVVAPENGHFGFGDHYMRNMTVWSVLFALSDSQSAYAPAAKQLLMQLKNLVAEHSATGIPSPQKGGRHGSP